MDKSLISENISFLIKIGVGLIFILVPLAVFPWFIYPLTTPKIIVFQTLTELIFALWLVNLLLDEGYQPRVTPLTTAVFVFLLLISISSFLGSNIQKSLWGLIDRGTGLVLLWHLFALFLVIKSLKEHITFKWFAVLNVITGAIVSFLAIIQRFVSWPISLTVSSFDRVYSTLSNAPFLAGYLIFTLFFGIWLFITIKEKKPRLMLGLVIFLNIVVIFLTGTRSAIVGLATGAFFLLLYLIFKKGVSSRLIALLIIAVLLGAGLLFFFTRGNSFWQRIPGVNRFISSSLEENLNQRLVFWDIARKGFKEKPVFGWGLDNFDVVFWKHYNPEEYKTQINYIFAGAPEKPFNVLFEYLVSGGILGLLSYLAIFTLSFYNLVKRKGLAAPFIIAALLIAYFVNNLGIFDTIATYPFFFSLLAFIDNDKQGEFKDKSDKKITKKSEIFTAVFLLLIIGVLPIYTINGKTAYAALKYYRAQKILDSEENLSESLLLWQEAIETSSPYKDEIIYSYAKEIRRTFDRGVKYSDWPSLSKNIVNKLENLTSLYPDNTRFYLELGNAYNSFSSINGSLYLEKGENSLQKATRLAPNNAQIHLSLAKNRIMRKDENGAIAEVEIARYLHPGLSDSKILLAILHYQSGNKTRSLTEVNGALLKNILPIYGEENIIFGDLNADDKNYKNAIVFYEQALKSPFIAPRRLKILNTKLKLGLAYSLDNQKEAAREIFKKLEKELPLLGEAESYRQLKELMIYLGL